MARGKRFMSGHVHPAVGSFPADPEMGQTAFKDGVLYIYSQIGALTTWYPINKLQSSHVHSQGVAQTTWTINHGLGTNEVIAVAYDDTGAILEGNVTTVFNSEANDITRYQLVLEFSEAVLGFAVIFSTETLGAPAVVTETVNAQAIYRNNVAVVTVDELEAALQELSDTFQQYA